MNTTPLIFVGDNSTGAGRLFRLGQVVTSDKTEALKNDSELYVVDIKGKDGESFDEVTFSYSSEPKLPAYLNLLRKNLDKLTQNKELNEQLETAWSFIASAIGLSDEEAAQYDPATISIEQLKTQNFTLDNKDNPFAKGENGATAQAA